MSEVSQNAGLPEGTRSQVKGLRRLYGLCLGLAFGVMPAISLLPSFAVSWGILELMIPVVLLTPIFVSIGYAFTVPADVVSRNHRKMLFRVAGTGTAVDPVLAGISIECGFDSG